jgi:hypothetical protein
MAGAQDAQHRWPPWAEAKLAAKLGDPAAEKDDDSHFGTQERTWEAGFTERLERADSGHEDTSSQACSSLWDHEGYKVTFGKKRRRRAVHKREKKAAREGSPLSCLPRGSAAASPRARPCTPRGAKSRPRLSAATTTSPSLPAAPTDAPRHRGANPTTQTSSLRRRTPLQRRTSRLRGTSRRRRLCEQGPWLHQSRRPAPTSYRHLVYLRSTIQEECTRGQCLQRHQGPRPPL